MICKKCGYNNSDDNAFCMRCGSTISQNNPSRKKFCPKCGNENKAEAAFCVKCGASMAQKSHSVQSQAAPVYQQPAYQPPHQQQSYSSSNSYSDGYSRLNEGINPWILRGLFVLPILTLFLAFFDFKYLTIGGFDLIFGDNVIDKANSVFGSGSSPLEGYRATMLITLISMIVGVCYPNIVTPIISLLAYLFLLLLLATGDALQAFDIGFYLGLLANLIMVGVMAYNIYMKRQNGYTREQQSRDW